MPPAARMEAAKSKRADKQAQGFTAILEQIEYDLSKHPKLLSIYPIVYLLQGGCNTNAQLRAVSQTQFGHSTFTLRIQVPKHDMKHIPHRITTSPSRERLDALHLGALDP